MMMVYVAIYPRGFVAQWLHGEIVGNSLIRSETT